MLNQNTLKYLFLPVLLFLGLNGIAQTIPQDTVESRWKMFTYDIGNIFSSVGHSYTRPLHWKGRQWADFGMVVGGTGFVYLFDDNTSSFIRNNREGVPQWLRDYGETYGNPENNYIATSGVYFTGLILKNEKLRRTGVLLVASATSAGLLQQVLKSAVGRARPLAELGKDTFDPFNSSRIFHSFPSGHAILAFTNAYAIAKQFKNPWIKAGIYTVGAIPGLSRIWDGQHWLSDMVFAFAISIATVESIDRYLDAKYDQKYNDQNKKVSWNLTFGPGQIGLNLRF